jgi:hypothetical protein
MTVETFNWSTSTGKYTEYESTNQASMDAIYGVNCPECDEELYNTSFDPDADSPSWLYECHECELYVRVRPVALVATASDMAE